MTIQDLIEAARRRFVEAGIVPQGAASDAELLAREALGWDRARLLTSRHALPPPAFREQYAEWVRRRAAREPVTYIIGHREFWRLDFEVSPGVLIPRPETEFIVEEALACLAGGAGRAGPAAGADPASTRAASSEPLRVVDVGTGTGCLAVSLACELPSARVIATDTSSTALAVAARNARRHGVGDRVRFVRADLLAGVGAGPHAAGERVAFDAIVSNPPYVPAGDVRGLSPEVRNEPAEALVGGDDGLDVIRRLVPQSADRLRPGGWLTLEFGYGQEDAVTSLIAGHDGLELVRIRADLQGIPRTAVVRKR